MPPTENLTEIPAESFVSLFLHSVQRPKEQDNLSSDMKTYSLDAIFELYTAF